MSIARLLRIKSAIQEIAYSRPRKHAQLAEVRNTTSTETDFTQQSVASADRSCDSRFGAAVGGLSIAVRIAKSVFKVTALDGLRRIAFVTKVEPSECTWRPAFVPHATPS
jgi:hypothetical protein